MLGAIIGDLIGSSYEVYKDKLSFNSLDDCAFCTGNTVLTIAVGDSLTELKARDPEDEIRASLANYLRFWAKQHPGAGYKWDFYNWAHDDNDAPYDGFQSDCAARVSAAGWLYKDMFTTRYMARLTAIVTHNHIDGIKGAEATAAAIFLARTGSSKDEIKDYIEKEFGYSLSPSGEKDKEKCKIYGNCEDGVPKAISAFLEANSFKETLLNCCLVELGTGLVCSIAGAIAEAYYGVPTPMLLQVYKHISKDQMEVIKRIYNSLDNRKKDSKDTGEKLLN